MNFDSGFEELIYNSVNNAEVKYHPPNARLSYVLEKNYEPDFVYTDGSIVTYIEAKGRFRDKMEVAKYLAVRKNLKWNEELVFALQNPRANMPQAKRRRDGSKYSISEWCTKHGFDWYTVDTMPSEWRKK